jgi:hypothetical protein
MKKQAYIVVLWIAFSLIVGSCSSAASNRVIEPIDEPQVLDTATQVLATTQDLATNTGISNNTG